MNQFRQYWIDMSPLQEKKNSEYFRIVDQSFYIPFPVQNGNCSFQNGKIIISINIKNIL